MAAAYSANGCDELVFYDIAASAESRPIDLAMVQSVARAIRIPFAVGGSVGGLADIRADAASRRGKISVNSLAVRCPRIIAEGARAFGAQCIVLGMDHRQRAWRPAVPSGCKITIRGCRERTGLDALEWAKRAAGLGAGEIVVNSVDADGTRAGRGVRLTRMIADAVDVPVVASSGSRRNI